MGSLTAHLVPTVGLIISHLPFGPTAYFTLCNVVMRHDIPDLDTVSEAKPHLITHGFSSRLGKRVSLGTLGKELGIRPGICHFPSLYSRFQTSSVTCSLCPKMTATGSSLLQTRMITSHSGGSLGWAWDGVMAYMSSILLWLIHCISQLILLPHSFPQAPYLQEGGPPQCGAD